MMTETHSVIASTKADRIATEIRAELRSILRLRHDLRTPLQRFEPLPAHPVDGLRFYVMFDLRAHRRITGLKLGGLNKLSLPDERIRDQAYEFAKAVWHLKDRLHQFVKAIVDDTNIEAFAQSSLNLRICSDLANMKKHGRNKNRSELNPRVGNVNFDTSRNGKIELFYDGSAKDKEVVVERPIPIAFTVELLIDDGTASMDDAVEIISRAFDDWLPLIRRLGILDGDNNEAKHLCDALSPESADEAK